nr:M15 family metallopeptidase [Candidatus Paceibacterota bacterium]
SAYRSFDTQETLKEGYKVRYGAGTANSFSADQGYSEHQLGTTLDFTMPELGTGLVGFDKTPGFPWLKDHAHEYGFILSYPKGNGHFVFEPWHWRYVGVELASRLHQEGKSFYDLDQRLIDTYLISFND